MENINLCIAYPNKSNYSETFIRTQINQIKPQYSVYGSWYPIYDQNNEIFLKFPIDNFFLRGILRNTFPKLFQKVYTNQFISFIIRNKIEVVLAQYGPTGCSVAEACNKTKIPLIVHFHGFDASEYKTLGKYRKSYQRLFEISSKIIVVSEVMRNDLIKLGAPSNKVINNPYGVDLEKFSFINFQNRPPVFITVGRFTEKKNPQLTIKAFKIVKKEFSDAKLIMIGDGPLLAECKKFVKELNLESSITFLGVRSSEEIKMELEKSRIFIQHSVKAQSGDMEGTPNSILEASAMALPIVSTKHSGILEAVVHNETGFLVNEGDYKEMAKYMLLLLNDTELSKRMGQNARKFMIKNYSIDYRIGKLTEIIYSVVNRNF